MSNCCNYGCHDACNRPQPCYIAGPTGPTGAMPAVVAAETITGQPGTQANVRSVQTPTGTNLYFTIPAGVTGPQGQPGQAGLIGPTGPRGEIATISGYYDSYTNFIEDHPTGTAGELYIVEGVLYGWDTATRTWNALGRLEGPTGPTGPASILSGYYDSYASFIADHPTGTAGELYLVDGELYAWDDASGEWTSLGRLEGPTGPTGPVAVISDYYDDYASFIADHPTGTAGELYIVEGDLYEWNDATGQWEALGRLEGPTGPTGPISVISGYYDSYNSFIADHPTGMAGELYIVEGELYAWNEATGQWDALGSLMGPTGPTGEPGPSASATIIPFASQQAPHVSTNPAGQPLTVALIGFGYMEYTAGLAEVSIPVDTNDQSFNMADIANRQIAFSLPFDMTINSVYATVGNWQEFALPPTGTLVFPYVQLYAAPPNSNTFLPIAGAVAKPEQGIDPATAAVATMRAASVDGLNINVLAGTRIAIGGMMEITGDSTGREYYLYYTGGIGMTRWIR